MNDEEFMQFASAVRQYLETPKVFVQNPQRIAEVNAATEIACKLFPEANITLEDDPLQMGAIILIVEDFDITVRETKAFCELVSKADNFEVYATDDEKVKLAIMFNNALTRI